MWITKTQWKAFKAWMTRINNLLIILGLFVLDIRDIYYKIAWLGPYETFSFRAGSTSVFNPNPLVIVDAQQPTPGASVEFGSGWPSFLARCERLHALGADGGPCFLSALGVNCILRDATSTDSAVMAPRLVMTSDQRLDTLVWASCVLLHVSRRPEICHDRIVSMFNVRYDFPEVELDRSMIAEPFSAAEDELLEFLAMASDSYPMHKVICVEAFELENKHEAPTAYSPSLFGCASPSSFASAFLGVKNPQIKTLVARKGWLTADVIVIMNLRYLIRQNCYSVYSVAENAEKGSLVLTSHTKSNFLSYGQLYALLLIIDVLLLTLNCLSSLELI